MTVIHPIQYRIILRKITLEESYWHFIKSRTFYNPLNLAQNSDIEFMFGTSKKKVALELFRINCGKPGYYLADLSSKKYYYCGVDEESSKAKLRSLLGLP